MLQALIVIFALILSSGLSYLLYRAKKDQMKTEVELQKTQNRVDLQNSQLELLSNALQEKSQEIQSQKSHIMQMTEDFIVSAKTLGESETKSAALEANLKNVNETLADKFNTMAQTIFDSYSSKFSENSKLKIEEIAAPLKDRLDNLQKKITDCYDIEAKEKFSLKEAIKSITHSNDQIRQEAHKLTNALKGNKLALGSWGEIVLNNILESTGLRKGIDFITQSSLESGESGDRLKPDVVIKLPENRCLVIDAKTSFLDFDKYESMQDPKERELLVKNFVQRLKAHIDSLAGKKYHAQSLDSPELTLMFIPVEAWYNVAISHNALLHQYAWEKNIAVVSPPMLFIALKTVAHVWKGRRQQQNVLEVADSAGKMYDQFVEFVEVIVGLEKLLGRAQDGCAKAMHKLVSGRGNLVKRAEKLRTLGAKTTKIFEAAVLERAEQEEDSEALREKLVEG